MQKVFRLVQLMLVVGLLGFAATAASAQTNSGTVTINGTVSKFVELTSGGPVTVANSSGGAVTTNGTLNNPLAVVLNLGELGPTNTASFVTATVPLKLRSNAPYVLSMSATVNSSGTTANKIGASDIGFGLGSVTRTGLGVYTSGVDTNTTSGDPTLDANGAINATSGRFEFTAAKSSLNNFTTTASVLSGDRIMNAVPSSNTNGLTVPAIFAVKPQFFEPGTTTATVAFTIAAP